MNNFDLNIVIVCVAALLVAGLAVVAVLIVCVTALVSVWYLTDCLTASIKAAKNNTKYENNHISDISESTDPDGRKKRKNINFDALTDVSDDELINEFNKIEQRGRTPHSQGIIERKQLLSLEIHKRNKNRQPSPQEGEETV